MNADLQKLIAESGGNEIAAVRMPEMGGVVLKLKAWTAGERVDFDTETAFLEEHLEETQRRRLLMPRAVVWSLVDDDGQKVYDVPALTELRKAAKEGRLDEALAVYRVLEGKRAKAVQRLYNAVSDLNALSEEDEEDAEGNC